MTQSKQPNPKAKCRILGKHDFIVNKFQMSYREQMVQSTCLKCGHTESKKVQRR
jgi:hypothetical protein